ncbi:MAG TPA: alpha/beta hydrolase [Solirubrobacteraceae bacterium]|jgi:pimeloyl-ACP methyl ester carboxylesterase
MSDELVVQAGDGTTLAVERAGEGTSIVLLHGLTATRRYVVMGSRMLERSGCDVVAYDARGHGRSAPAAETVGEAARGDAEAIRNALAAGDARSARVTLDVETELHDAYGYKRLAADLEALLNALGIERAVLAGASMGAHTLVRFALEHPERVIALGLITPAYDADTHGAGGERAFAHWDALAAGLRDGGVEGFIAAYDFSSVPEGWRPTVETVVRQRLAAHEHPQAVADALEAVPRSRPFEAMAELRDIAAPTLVVGSRDEADPGHPLAVAERYAQLIPGARLLVEELGSSPIAWQGGQLSKALLELVASG